MADEIQNTGIQFEDIVPWVGDHGDTGLSVRLKLKRNFDKIKAWMDSQGVDRNIVRQMIEEMGAELFLSKVEEDIAQEPIGFMKGFWIKAKELFGITEDGDAKLRNLDVDSLVRAADIQSPSYTGDGMADTGFRLTARDNTGSSKLTVDNLYVRKKATFEELEVRKETAIAGNQIYSGAANVILRTDYYGLNDPDSPESPDNPIILLGYSTFRVPWLVRKAPHLSFLFNRVLKANNLFTRVCKTKIFIETEDIPKIRFVRCYFLAKDDDREVYNLWKVEEHYPDDYPDVSLRGKLIPGTGNDLARCQTMNLLNSKRQTYLRGMESKLGNVYWWRKLCGVSTQPAVLDDGRYYHYIDVVFNYAEEEAYREAGMPCPWADLASGDIPAAGDHVVQFGNDMNPDRMNLIAVEVNSSADAPAHKWYRGIYTFDLTKCWWGGSPRKAMLSAATGYEFYGPNFKVITEYGIAQVPKDRPEVNWSDITPQRDDYGSHTNVRKCYYYDQISHNGCRWLCLNTDDVHWVRPQVFDDDTYALYDADGNYRHNGNRITDLEYYALTVEQRAQCGREPNYTTKEPGTDSQIWKMIVAKGDNSVRIDLDNENDAMLYSSSKGLISGNVVSNAYLFDGINDVSSLATWSINAVGCTATISNRVVTVTAMSATTGSVTVTAVYNGTSYTAKLSLKKILDADKYELVVTPNSVAYNSSTDTPAASTLAIQVWKTACDGTRALSAPPSGYNIYANGNALTASATGTYSYTTDNSAISDVLIKIATSATAANSLDAETIPITKAANGAKGDKGDKGDDGTNGTNGEDGKDGKDGTNGVNGKDGWMVTANPANVIITQDMTNTSSFTTAAVSFAAKKGSVSANVIAVSISSWNHFTGSVANNVVTVTAPTASGGVYYSEGSFTASVSVTDPDTDGTVVFSITVLCYANLMGTFKTTIEGDVETSIANKDFYYFDGNGDVVKKTTLGEYIRASETASSRLKAIIDGKATESYVNQKASAVQIGVKNDLNDTGIDITNGLINLRGGKVSIDDSLTVPRVDSIDNSNGLQTTVVGGVVTIQSTSQSQSKGIFGINANGEVVLQMFDKDGKLVVNLGGSADSISPGSWKNVPMRYLGTTILSTSTKATMTANAIGASSNPCSAFCQMKLGYSQNTGLLLKYYLPIRGTETSDIDVTSKDGSYYTGAAPTNFPSDSAEISKIKTGTLISDGWYVKQNNGVFMMTPSPSGTELWVEKAYRFSGGKMVETKEVTMAS